MSSSYNPDLHHRRSIRLRGYDYSREGLYFVTICVQKHECIFGKVVDDGIQLNEYGKMIEECWKNIPVHYPIAVLHHHIVMPNHFHGIIEIVDKSIQPNPNDIPVGVEYFRPNPNDTPVGVEYFRPNPNDQSIANKNPDPRSSQRPNCTSGTLGAIIRGFKIGTTKMIGYSVWQRGYHEHIIRNEAGYKYISDYIVNNPSQWYEDKFNIIRT
jgi:REP element-mobilizing transposase RayT